MMNRQKMKKLTGEVGKTQSKNEQRDN